MGDKFYNETHTWPRGLKAKLIRLDGDRCFVCHCQQKPFAIHHFYEDGPGKTRWVLDSEFKFSGLMRILSLFMKGSFSMQTADFMNDFKEFAEAE